MTIRCVRFISVRKKLAGKNILSYQRLKTLREGLKQRENGLEQVEPESAVVDGGGLV
jgi:hypothetical protein